LAQPIDIYFFKLWTYAATSSKAAPETDVTGFILPFPPLTIFLISPSLRSPCQNPDFQLKHA